MSSPRPAHRAVLGVSPAGGGGQPVRVDGALRQTIALLELVRQEETLLGWLDDCVAQLHAVRRARQTLLDLTDLELAEAKEAADPRGADGSWRSDVRRPHDASASATAECDLEGSAS